MYPKRHDLCPSAKDVGDSKDIQKICQNRREVVIPILIVFNLKARVDENKEKVLEIRAEIERIEGQNSINRNGSAQTM